MLLSQPLPRRLYPTVSAVGRVLSIKQLPGGELLVGGGGPALVDHDLRSCLVQPLSVERNVINSSRVAPWAAAVDLPVGWCGIDGETPDHLPLIGPAPGVEGLYLATGFSLGGFQMAPAVGELVAAEVSEGQPAAALEQLRPARFGSSPEEEIVRFQASQRGIPAR